MWSAQTGELAEQARFQVPDLSPYDTVSAMAQAVLDEAPPRFSLVGFSLGGWVALSVVTAAPERVERLALLSTTAHALFPSVQQSLSGALAQIESGGFDAYLEAVFPLYVAPEHAGSGPIKDTFMAMARDAGPSAALREIHSLVAQHGDAGSPGAVGCPTIVVCGREDERTPVAVHEELAGAIPGARLTVIDGSGHFTPLERPAEVTDALRRWLATD